MKFNLEKSSANFIHSYESGSVKIQQATAEYSSEQSEILFKILTKSFILTPTALLEDWAADAQLLTSEATQQVLDTQPDVILLGTGAKANFPSHQVIQNCYQAGAGIEIMNSSAACRTYNILASEQRKVAAALLVV